MSKFNGIAQKHWQTHRPKQAAAMENPDEFFAEIASQISETVQARATAIAGPDLPHETYMDKVARLSTARTVAESETLREMLPPPERDEDAPETSPAAQAIWQRGQLEEEAWLEAKQCLLPSEEQTQALYEQILARKLTQA